MVKKLYYEIVVKQGSVIFLKVTVLLLSLFVLAFCTILLPTTIIELAHKYLDIKWLLYLTWFGLSSASMFFLFLLYQSFKVLGYIGKNKFHSELSSGSLKYIKNCAIMMSVSYIAIMPIFAYVGEQDDAPGTILVGLGLILSPLVIVAISDVMQKILQSAYKR